jgi:cytochrome P450
MSRCAKEKKTMNNKLSANQSAIPSGNGGISSSAPTADAPVTREALNQSAATCPFHNQTFYGYQKTTRVVEPQDRPIERDAEGVWHVRNHDLARAILRSSDTRQAGFKAEMLAQIPSMVNQPVLYLEGKEHLEQRKQTARYFTPVATSRNYRQFMDDLAESLVGDLRRSGHADLSKLTMNLAVNVAAQVVGLTDSRLPGMDKRLDAFFQETDMEPKLTPSGIVSLVKMQWRVLSFLWLDVQPAIVARRKQPREDVITHLVQSGRNDREILTECITYGAAGMVTTREFIGVAAWHMLEHPDLRARYLAAGEEERYAILHEILRLEPVAGHLHRRAVKDVVLEHAGTTYTIPTGALIDLHINATNTDRAVVGERPLQVCPGRELHGDRIGPTVMSFGDGHHRCPGAYVAIQESDIFLQKLLAIDTLRIERTPEVTFSDLTGGYELRKFLIRV